MRKKERERSEATKECRLTLHNTQGEDYVMSGYNGLVVVVDVCRGREKSESAREMQEEGEEQTRKKGIE